MINQEKDKEEVREYKGKGGRILSVRVGTEGIIIKLLKSCLWTQGDEDSKD